MVENCTFDETGFTITNSSVTGSSNYILINDVSAKIVLRNCQILSDSGLGNVSPINSSLTSAATFIKFIYIVGRDTEIIDCIINGPDQTFTSATVTYNLPSLFIESLNSVRVTNTKFYGGALPLQLGGTNFTKGSVIIQGNEFFGNGAVGQYTQLDIDFNYTVVTAIKYTIIIANNVFQEIATTTDIQVQHTNMTSAAYNAQGVVQIYANNYDVIFANNKILTTSQIPSVNPYTHFSGAVINCFDSTTHTGSRPCSVAAHDNSINITNNYNSTNAAQTVSALWVKSADIKIHNNFLQVNNITANTNLAGCAYLNAQAINGYSDAIVTGNSFSSRDSFGNSTTNLNGGFVIIDALSGRGRIVDNSFSDTTVDGRSTVPVLIKLHNLING